MSNLPMSEQDQENFFEGYGSHSRLLRDLIMGFRTTQIISTAAKINLASHLRHGPRTVAQLAVSTKTDETRLFRLVRALTALGLLENMHDGTFALSPLGHLLGDVPGSLRNVAILYGERWLWEAYSDLPFCIQNDESAFEHVHGKRLYDYLRTNPIAAETFNKAMTAFSDHEAEAVKAAYDFSNCKTIVDVGGGEGFFVLSLLKDHSEPSGIVFDLPGVVSSAGEQNLSERIKYVAGDFFESVYPGGDVYILKSVLHNWDDVSCLAILKNCYKAMGPAMRLLIIERIIPAEVAKSEAVLFDINMLVMTQGQERTESEYKRLLDDSGFFLHQVIPTKAAVSILECIRKI